MSAVRAFGGVRAFWGWERRGGTCILGWEGANMLMLALMVVREGSEYLGDFFHNHLSSSTSALGIPRYENRITDRIFEGRE